MNATGPNVVAFTQLTITTEFHSCAAFSCLLYDFVLSMDDEITLIWRSADTIPKFLYFVSRYLGLAVQAFHAVSCIVSDHSTLYPSFINEVAPGEIAAVFAMDITAFPQFYHLAIHYPSDWPVRGCFYPEVLSFFKISRLQLIDHAGFLFWASKDTRHSSTVYHRATCLEHFPRGLGRYLGIRYTLLFGQSSVRDAASPLDLTMGRRARISCSTFDHWPQNVVVRK
ncbi:hypothetical protein POSPLADRAFT_1145934 [Postia placenta MAD-698-R-SB12]|uniref:DUF6533 domain-containing protein n=1 Tax=Postia placenta MAD-698-R-SB12 TaxID=670580 RepID=A0A1X6MXH1_9APHY|nr:hypothetical protein POSPLADRAFT_1145934 [Postia placenta MAD-698-R-SB12]OSX61068.1 hypothetical protein POSPLADRAFT_1145934 [Postia placenta MAD-698-R-SB12]